VTSATALFRTPEGEAEFMAAYDATLSLWDVAYDSSYVSTDFGETHVLSAGPVGAPPLVLLHGFGFSAGMWYPNVAAWSAGHRVFALDVPGEFNRTRTAKSIRRGSDYADWLAEVLDRLGLDTAIVIGHSSGGWQALNLAMCKPERVTAIVALAPAAAFVRFSWQFPVRLVAINLVRTRRMIIDFFAGWMLAPGNSIDPSLFEQFYLGIKHFGWRHGIVPPSRFPAERLRGITAPGLFVVGDSEVIYSPKRALGRVRELTPQFETAVVVGAGHGLSVEQPTAVNSLVLDFVRKHETSLA
jgi:pimeloyl-ACP methyl ester carboxylesterase